MAAECSESMLSKRPVPRFTAASFFLIFVGFSLGNGDRSLKLVSVLIL